MKDGKDEDLTQEPEQIRAFRDTWELGIHSYLTYLRDRLLLARELLTESGSIFVQISDENVHHVRELMDEVFGAGNFVSQLSFRTKIPLRTTLIANVHDYALWYARSKDHMKFRKLYTQKGVGDEGRFSLLLMPDGSRRYMTREEKSGEAQIPTGAKPFVAENLNSAGRTESCVFDFEYEGRVFKPTRGKSWKTNREGMKGLARAHRLFPSGNNLYYVLLHEDYPVQEISNIWNETRGEMDKTYVVQTTTTVIERCLLMTTDPGDLVFDPTCGSGTTAYVAEQWGRRWITCDTSRVALTLARQRLMTAVFDYYELAHPQEGVGSGFKYKTVPHVTLKSIANNPDIKVAQPSPAASTTIAGRDACATGMVAKPSPAASTTKAGGDACATGMTREQIDAAIARHAPQETLYDQPLLDRKKVRVSGPFTVEAVPAPAVMSVEEIVAQASPPAVPRREAVVKKRAGETPALQPALRLGWHDRGYLPHLKVEGGTYFVTFRLSDTLPKEVLEQYQFEREDIIKRAEAMGRELSPDKEKRLAELYSERIESYLDAGAGKCWLKVPEIAGMMVDTLQHFDGLRYDLHAWVVMPNHIHVVVTPRKDYTLSNILHSWKSFTAHEVQKVAQASRLQIPAGEAFWQRESYDYLVRDEADFARVCEYTIQNPVKAGLCEKPEEWPFSSASDVLSKAGASDVLSKAGETPALLPADASIARSGETLRQGEWRDELLRAGIRGKSGQHIRFARLEPLPGCRWLHADGETRPSDVAQASPHASPKEKAGETPALRIVVSFGPEHAPLEQRQLAQAIEEAQTLVPKPKLIVFAAFHFDPEAAKDIDETHWPGVTLLKAQMNADLLTDDLKKKRASNESFWLIGQPDVELRTVAQASSPAPTAQRTSTNAGETPALLYQVEVKGFDYYNTKTGEVESGGEEKITVWLLDTDYDGRSLYPRQVFFPMAGEKEGWARLAKNLKAEIDEERIEAYRGTVSLPFEAGEHQRIAVKIVDDRGIESLKVLEIG